jgi:hypothetical protein
VVSIRNQAVANSWMDQVGAARSVVDADPVPVVGIKTVVDWVADHSATAAYGLKGAGR